MALKDILIHLDGGRGQTVRLELATELARRHQAQLSGIFGTEPTPLGAIGMPSLGSAAEVEAVQIAIATARAATDDMGAAVEQEFRAAIARAGVTGAWRDVAGDIAEVVTAYARCADLTVVGQFDPDDLAPASSADLPERVLLGSGRPVLMVPYIGPTATFGRRVLIAWNATREAARAVADALPLLADAEAVVILSIEPPSDDTVPAEPTAAQLVRHLARHGISAEASSLVLTSDVSVADLLLSRAADLGTDLIVMGGYGHSPTREFILGGATRSLLQHMTVPVLMSH